MCTKHAWIGLGLLILAGCYAPVRPDVDRLICASALQPVDPQPISTVEAGSMLPAPKSASLGKASLSSGSDNRPDAHFGDLILASAQDKKAPDIQEQGKPSLLQRLQVPAQLEGSSVPPLVMPDPKNKVEYDQAVKKYFPSLPEIGPDPQAGPGPEGRPLALADLQQLARANSPLLRQAATDVEAARGAMQTAGQYANPTFGYQGSSAGPGGGPTNGPFIGQTITTMGKLKLARAAAEKDLENAELAYRRAETDLIASVRTGYFSVLVAEENIRQNRALVTLTDEIYKVMVLQLKGGEFATYEPMQVGVFAAQARTGLIQARNGYTLAWKQLAASLGLPAMPPTALVGNVRALAIPKYRYDTVLAHVLSDHTDVRTALNGIDKARYNLRLAQVTPVPDINAQVGLTDDESQPGPYRMTGNFQVSVTLPVWNINQGGIWSAQSALMRANEEPHRVRDDLTGRVADAYRRYSENFDLLEMYHRDILPMQVQAYRSTVQRHYGGEAGGVAYLDLVTAEQTLVGVIGSYLTVLQAQWQAVADLGSLLQTNDIFQLAEGKRFSELPDLSHLMELPCCHPCNPLPNDAFKGAQLNWPEAGFGPNTASGLGAPIPGDDHTLLAPQLGTTTTLPAPAQQTPAIGGLQFSSRRS
jgi:outer membrane protein, heavy metal efflux system